MNKLFSLILVGLVAAFGTASLLLQTEVNTVKHNYEYTRWLAPREVDNLKVINDYCNRKIADKQKCTKENALEAFTEVVIEKKL